MTAADRYAQSDAYSADVIRNGQPVGGALGYIYADMEIVLQSAVLVLGSHAWVANGELVVAADNVGGIL